jgi:hypothetical protein
LQLKNLNNHYLISRKIGSHFQLILPYLLSKTVRTLIRHF